MHVDAVPLTPDTLPSCASLWGGAESYSTGELEGVLDAGALLLYARRAQGAVVLEDGRPRAFGLTVFAHEAFVDAYLVDPHPQIGRRLLLDVNDPGSTSVLQRHEIAERNEEGGLQVVVANTAFDPMARDPDTVLGQLIAVERVVSLPSTAVSVQRVL